MLIPTGSIVLVTDGARLVQYRQTGPAAEPRLEREDAVELVLPSSAELGNSAPGRSFQSFSTRRSAYEAPDPHDAAETRFATEAADRVAALVADGHKVVLAAAPRALGVIRKALPAEARAALLAEIDADYSKHDPAELARLLAARRSDRHGGLARSADPFQPRGRVTEPPSPFAYPAFRAFFVARLGSTLAQIMMVVVIGWQVYDLARQTMPVREAAFLLGLVGLAQFLPVFLLSLVVGVVADRVDRRHIARAAVALELLCALGLAAVAESGSASLASLFAIALALGMARAFASPSLQALAPNLVPAAVLPTAIAWNSIGWQAGAILGPVIGGFAYDASPARPYLIATILLIVALVALFRIPPIQLPADTGARGLAAVREGLGYVRSTPIVLGAISLDLFAVILAGASAMLPVFVRDILMVGPDGLGLLRAAPAVGAAVVALALTRNPLGSRVGIKMFAGVGLFALSTIAFGLSESLPLSVAALLVMGGADMISVYVRSSLIQLHTPDSMRGRVSAVSMLFISASNELGEFRAGTVAALIGPVAATVLGGLLAFGVTLLWMRLFPELRDADRLDIPDLLKRRQEA